MGTKTKLVKVQQTTIAEDGCLSYPGIRKMIRRSVMIDVSYEDASRISRRHIFTGWDARVCLHEMDHLDGICLVGDPNYIGEEPPKKPSLGLAMAIIAAVAGRGVSR